jgi:hypothetical protein
MSLHNEYAFENEVCDYLAAHRWLYEPKDAATYDRPAELMNAIMGALDAHNSMSSQALGSEAIRDGLRRVLLDHAGLYEALRQAAKPSAP